MASSAYKHKNNKVLYDLLNTRDMILNELHQHVFLKDDAITPCIFLLGIIQAIDLVLFLVINISLLC
ncbi:DUF4049 domain-containing protein [Escherichia coli]|nr:DUF4049 domain-containing protein [Escherichia coli]